MRVDAYIHALVARLAALYPRQEAQSLGLMLLDHYASLSSHVYYTQPDTEIPASARVALNAALEDLALGRPIQYVLGSTCFDGLDLRVREGVLIPRPETEELLRWAAEWLTTTGSPEARLRILDLCTGSGALALALAKRFPRAEVFGVDVSEQALEQALENSRSLGLAVQYMQGDILKTGPGAVLEAFATNDDMEAGPDAVMAHFSANMTACFDLIISNPPYVCASEAVHMRRNVLDYEPALALFVPDADPLRFYRALAAWGKRCLKPTGALMMEINEAFGTELVLLFETEGFTQVCLRQDLFGKDRMLQAIL